MKIPGTKTIGNTKVTDLVKVTERGRIAIPASMRRDHGLEKMKFYLLHFNEEENTLYATFYEKKEDADQPPISFRQLRLEVLPLFNQRKMKIGQGVVQLEWDNKYKAIKVDLSVLML